MTRENLNAKIEVCLELFEELNVEMTQNKIELASYYDEVKNNMVKVLNEIVENYVYRDPNKKPYEGELDQNSNRVTRASSERTTS